MNCTGGDCPIKGTCKRYAPVKKRGMKFYPKPPYWNGECNFYFRDETAEEMMEARREEQWEKVREQLGSGRG